MVVVPTFPDFGDSVLVVGSGLNISPVLGSKVRFFSSKEGRLCVRTLRWMKPSLTIFYGW